MSYLQQLNNKYCSKNVDMDIIGNSKIKVYGGVFMGWLLPVITLLMFIGSIFFALAGFMALGSEVDGGGYLLLLSLALFIGSFVAIVKGSKSEVSNNRKLMKSYKSFHNIPDVCDTVGYIGGHEKIDTEYGNNYTLDISNYNFDNLYMWKEQNKLLFVSYFETLTESLHNAGVKFDLDINNIVSFSIFGDSYTETNISGGGSSIGGAIAGAIVAGGAGAVIGSRKEIKTENKRIDNRKTIIVYNESGKVESIFFSPKTYEVLLKLIPNKETNISKNFDNNASKYEDDTKSAVGAIRELAKLREEGIITDIEFQAKKRDLMKTIN